VCTGIYDLDPVRGGPTFYGGAYHHYLREKRIERQNWQYQWRTEQEQLRALHLSVAQTAREVGKFRPIKDKNKMAYDRRGEHAQRQISRRVRTAAHRLDELTRDQVSRPPDPLRLDAAMTAAPVEVDRALGTARRHSARAPGPGSARPACGRAAAGHRPERDRKDHAARCVAQIVRLLGLQQLLCHQPGHRLHQCGHHVRLAAHPIGQQLLQLLPSDHGRGYPSHRPAPLVGPMTPDMIEQATYFSRNARTSLERRRSNRPDYIT
jgi:hypothetical protein